MPEVPKQHDTNTCD